MSDFRGLARKTGLRVFRRSTLPNCCDFTAVRTAAPHNPIDAFEIEMLDRSARVATTIVALHERSSI